jgi:hypothetical protein
MKKCLILLFVSYMRKVLGVVAPMRYDSGPCIMTRVMTLHHGARYDARHGIAS